MKLFGLLPKCLGNIFNGVSHFACNSRQYRMQDFSKNGAAGCGAGSDAFRGVGMRVRDGYGHGVGGVVLGE